MINGKGVFTREIIKNIIIIAAYTTGVLTAIERFNDAYILKIAFDNTDSALWFAPAEDGKYRLLLDNVKEREIEYENNMYTAYYNIKNIPYLLVNLTSKQITKKNIRRVKGRKVALNGKA